MAEIIERNSEGKIVKSKLSSNQARQMARARWDKDKNARIEALLQEKGFTRATAPASLLLWAEKSVSGRTGNVSAQARLDAWGKEDKSGVASDYNPQTDFCPLCARPPLGDGDWVSFNRVMADWFRKFQGDPVSFVKVLVELLDKHPPTVEEERVPPRPARENHEEHGERFLATPRNIFDVR